MPARQARRSRALGFRGFPVQPRASANPRISGERPGHPSGPRFRPAPATAAGRPARPWISRASRSIRQRWTLLPSNSAARTSRAIGISTPRRSASARAASTVYAPSATPGSVASMSVHGRPLASSTPRRWFRDSPDAARRDDVADPRQPRERQRIGAGRDAQPDHLGQAARDQSRLAVVAEAQSVGSARRDRNDVLQRTAQLDPDDVGVHVEPERPRPDPRLDAPGKILVLGSDDRRRGQPAGNLSGEVRAGKRGDPPTSMSRASARTSLIRSSEPRSSPLTSESTSARPSMDGATCAATSRRWVDGTANTTRSADARAVGSPVTRTPSENAIPGRFSSLRRSPRVVPPCPVDGRAA